MPVPLVLDEPRHRHVVRREAIGKAGEDARPVVDLDVDVVGRPQLPTRERIERAPAGVVLQERRSPRSDDADEIRDDRGGGLDPARARPRERDLADRVPWSMTALNAPSTAAHGW